MALPKLLVTLTLLTWSLVKPISATTASLQTSRLISRDGSTPNLRYAKDSGICETTPGVHQYSGYVDIGTSMSTWFWFFESRKSPFTAPLTIWFNGGPGCSSMIGLFRAHGPCKVNPDKTTTRLNPYSWNEVSNMLYIDQPIGVGFSYGSATVNTTDSAAPPVWAALQILFQSPEFSKYTKNELILGAEGCGGHFGPSFITYFNSQNDRIQRGELAGVPIVVSTLLINSGWYDPLIQNGAYIQFTANAPGHGPLQNSSILATMTKNYFKPGGCLDLERQCYKVGSKTDDVSNAICANATTNCLLNVFVPAVTSLDPYDLRQNSSALFPPRDYVSYLQLPEVQTAIGAQVTYSDCSPVVAAAFGATGDNARSQLSTLAALVDSRMRVLIWAGDADIICNWVGGYDAISAMSWYGQARLALTPFRNITSNGRTIAAVKNVDNFSFARVYDAGHAIPAFQPESAFEIFRQIVARQPLHSA